MAGRSATGSTCCAVMTADSPTVDGGVAAGPVEPFAHAGQERPLGGHADAGARVVEREHRGRAPERRRHGVAEEPVRLVVRRDPRVGVDVDDARQDQQVGGVDDPRRGRRGDARLDGHDPPIADGHVRDPRAVGP